jgi:hypothetical protein
MLTSARAQPDQGVGGNSERRLPKRWTLTATCQFLIFNFFLGCGQPGCRQIYQQQHDLGKNSDFMRPSPAWDRSATRRPGLPLGARSLGARYRARERKAWQETACGGCPCAASHLGAQGTIRGSAFEEMPKGAYFNAQYWPLMRSKKARRITKGQVRNAGHR